MYGSEAEETAFAIISESRELIGNYKNKEALSIFEGTFPTTVTYATHLGFLWRKSN